MLERHIAVNLPASHIDAAEAIAGLHAASSENFSERLTRFVNLMLGSSEFALYLLRGSALKILFQSPQFDLSPADYLIASDHAVFDAVVRERRTIRPTEVDVAGGRGFLFGPILALDQNRVIGMLAVGGAVREDFPEDIDRCLALTASEISRFLGRVILTEPLRDAAHCAPNVDPMTEPVFSDAIVPTTSGQHKRTNQANYVPLSRAIRG